jgi:hypothetical protein
MAGGSPSGKEKDSFVNIIQDAPAVPLRAR